jgi:hypothetical protein
VSTLGGVGQGGAAGFSPERVSDGEAEEGLRATALDGSDDALAVGDGGGGVLQQGEATGECKAHREAAENPLRQGCSSKMATGDGAALNLAALACLRWSAADKRRWGEKGLATRSNGRETEEGEKLARWQPVLFKGGSGVEQWGRSEATPRGKEVGEGPSPTSMRLAAGNDPTVALTGGARSAPKQRPGTPMHGPETIVPVLKLPNRSNKFKFKI